MIQSIIKDLEAMLDLACPICLTPFNSKVQPYIVCNSQHVLCANCIRAVDKHHQIQGPKCPQCRDLLLDGRIYPFRLQLQLRNYIKITLRAYKSQEESQQKKKQSQESQKPTKYTNISHEQASFGKQQHKRTQQRSHSKQTSIICQMQSAVQNLEKRFQSRPQIAYEQSHSLEQKGLEVLKDYRQMYEWNETQISKIKQQKENVSSLFKDEKNEQAHQFLSKFYTSKKIKKIKDIVEQTERLERCKFEIGVKLKVIKNTQK